MNLRSIIEADRNYNFHTHTQFCDGHDTMDAIAAAAVNCGMKSLGFSPHSPISIASPCNMAHTDIDAYKKEVERLGKKYDGVCRIYCGMEVDYLGPEDCANSEFFESLGLDYKIGSVHFIRTRDGQYVDIDGHADTFKRKMHEYFHDDIRYVVEEYYRTSREMLVAGGFDILGHFDKIGHNASCFCPGIEEESWYRNLVDGYLREIISSGVVVEINTKAFAEHDRFFPNQRLWGALLEGDVPLMVNSDAHYAAKINAGRAEAFELLDSVRKEINIRKTDG